MTDSSQILSESIPFQGSLSQKLNCKCLTAKECLLPPMRKDPENRRGNDSHSATFPASQPMMKRQLCSCPPVYFGKANLKPQPNGRYLEVTGELNWHSFSREDTPCSLLNQTAATRRTYFHFFQND